MSLINEVYASAPADIVVINSLEILIPGFDPIRMVQAFQDYELGLEDSNTYTFHAAPYSFKEPSKDTNGQQTLGFSIPNVTGEAQRAVDFALNNNVQAQVIARVHLSNDLTTPARPPYRMVMHGGTFQGGIVQVEAGYFDILNTAWPRNRYTNEFAPGLRYM